MSFSTFKSKPRPRLWVGRKTRQWMKIRAQLKRQLREAGITRCEFRLSPECTVDSYLSLAHSKKRRFCNEADLYECAVACFACHQILDERMTHDEMFQTVRRVIAERKV